MAKTAELYRMATPDHLCPYGLKSKDLLEREGVSVRDHKLTSREETDAFVDDVGVETTPQTFIQGERIGGYDDLRTHFGYADSENGTTYRPVIAVFGMAAAMALAGTWVADGTLLTVRAVEWFVAFAMCLLAIQKLRDLEGFTTMFLNYDLLARGWVRYAYIYPFAEAFAGVLMVSGALVWLSAPVAAFIGAVGSVSVFKAVYIDKRELNCAYVGGGTNVPLGAVSLTENLMMVAMAVWMTINTLF